MGGQLVFLPHNTSRKGYAPEYRIRPGIHCSSIVQSIPRSGTCKITRLPAAFHLPEVCRQIYSETVLTAYQQNIFLFEEFHMRKTRPLSHIMVAQRRAITAVKIVDTLLHKLMRDYVRIPITFVLPNLECILISAKTSNFARHHYSLGFAPGTTTSTEEWQAIVAQKLKKLHGDVKVVFEN